jgi:1-acyl-sn-glycerol-3-phosphate acyltransferase
MRRLRRRAITIPAVVVAAVVSTALVPVWLPLTVVVDVLRGERRLPRTRLLAFGVLWAWCETAGVLASFGLWAVGKGRDLDAHYALQRWWASRLMGSLRVTCGIRVDVDGLDELDGGPFVVLCRHASLADSLVSAWVLVAKAGIRPRYVLKRELLSDPCLDIVGQRLPNHFLDRSAADSSIELAALAELGTGLGPRDAAVIFPEGTRANPVKRERALDRIAERDPARAERLTALTHLLPPRPAGTLTLLSSAVDADVALAWHTGFDGLDTFGGILDRLAHPLDRVRFVIHRVARSEVPSEAQAQARWLDDAWLRLDAEVRAELVPEADDRVAG